MHINYDKEHMFNLSPDRRYSAQAKNTESKFREATSDERYNQANFDHVQALAELLLEPLRSGKPQAALRNLRERSFPLTVTLKHTDQSAPKFILEKASYFGLLAKSTAPEQTYPVFLQRADLMLEYWIIPIPISTFIPDTSYDTSGRNNDAAAVLAAAALSAPHILAQFDQGMKNTLCPTNPDEVTKSIEAAHVAPVAIAFDHLKNRTNTQVAIRHISGTELSLVQAGHLHGIEKNTHILGAASASGIASGIEIIRGKHTHFGAHALHLPISEFEGKKKVSTMLEYLGRKSELNPALISGILAFSSQVVGNEQSAQQFEQIFKPTNAHTPISQLFR